MRKVKSGETPRRRKAQGNARQEVKNEESKSVIS